MGQHDPEDLSSRPLSRRRGERERRAGERPAVEIGITNQRETTILLGPRPSGRSTGDRLAGPPNGPLSRSCGARGQNPWSGADRARVDPYFSGTKIQLAAPGRPTAPRPGRAGRAGLRHRGHLAHLGADRRRGHVTDTTNVVADAALRPRSRPGTRTS